ncbi:MAG: asparaginase [Betaproteobacteria bacterium]
MNKPRVYVIGIGGSISCIGESRLDLLNYNYADRHLTIDEMIARVPEAREIADIRAEQFLNIYGGDIAPAQWLELARRIDRIFRDDSDAAGVVVTHGTSTLEETAYFLNLAVNSSKPVVITGSMRPPTGLSTDADINLYDAIRVAACPEAAGKGALVVLNNEIQAARDVTKTNTSRVETFKSGELGFLGYADSDGKVVFLRAPAHAHTAASEFCIDSIPALPRVDIAYAYSGVDGVAVKALVHARCAGIVSAGLGSGSAPRAYLDALGDARDRGVCIVIASQVGNGRVMAKRSFTEKGFLVADNLAPKKARILLMLALAQTRDAAEIQRMMLTY